MSSRFAHVRATGFIPSQTTTTFVDCDGTASLSVADPRQTIAVVPGAGHCNETYGHDGPPPSGVVRRGGKPYHFFTKMYFRILAPMANISGPVFTEEMLKTLHVADHRREGVTFRIDSDKGETHLAIECPASLKSVVINELQDSYPGLEICRAERPRLSQFTRACELQKMPDVFGLRVFSAFIDAANRNEFADPLSGVLSAIQTGRSGRVGLSIELCVVPASKRRLRQARRIREVLTREFRPKFAKEWYLRLASRVSFLSRLAAAALAKLASSTNTDVQNGSETDSRADFECRLVLVATTTANVPQIATRRLTEIAGAFARFNSPTCRLIATQIRPQESSRLSTSLLSATEIASLWHPPTKSTDNVVRVSRGNFRELEPPAAQHSLDKRDSIVLGRMCFRNDKSLVRISQDSLRRHLIAIGKTGCGKSTFLLNVVRQQMESGRGAVLIDPHGQLAEEVLRVVPRRRKNQVTYFDVSAHAARIGFNPMIGPPGADPTLVADGVLTSFKNVFGIADGSAPRLLHIFRNCLLSLIGTQHASLLNVQRMLVETNFRKSVIAHVQNQAVREFWLTEFNRWNERDRVQYVASLQNKLGAFLTNERLQFILTKPNGIQLRSLMDQSGILICNLSKGTVGHDASTLLGSLLLSSLQIAAMSRADLPEQDRRDCTVVVDEFHTYLAEGNTAMADALAESRKYRTSYVLAAQMLDQLDPDTLAGILGNCGSMLCMTVGPRDADVLAEVFGAVVVPQDLMRIPKFHGYLRTIGHSKSHAVSLKTVHYK